MNKVRTEAMKCHVLDLCERHGIEIEWHNGRGAWAIQDFDLIRIRPIRSAVTYAIALHEIGHHKAPNQRSRSPIAAT